MTSELCCGHWVNSVSEGVCLVIDEPGGRSCGLYCKGCADKLLEQKGVCMWQNFTGDYNFPITGDPIAGIELTEDDELYEVVKAIHTRCHIFFSLREDFENTKWMLPTLLEDLYEDCQEILEYCVERNDD